MRAAHKQIRCQIREQLSYKLRDCIFDQTSYGLWVHLSDILWDHSFFHVIYKLEQELK
jgi:hypothetical protein